MQIAFGAVRLTELRLAVLCLALAVDGSALAGEANTIQQVVETFAQSGSSTMAGSYGWAFGYADPVKKTPFATDSIFEIASVTKVFTTNLLGQAVFEKRLKLSDSLAQFPRQLGSFMVSQCR